MKNMCAYEIGQRLLEKEQKIRYALGAEFFRLRQLDIAPDVADVMKIIKPFLEKT